MRSLLTSVGTLFTIGLSVLLAACSGDNRADTIEDPGHRVYAQYCTVCHQPDGSGISRLYPPLSQTEWVEGDPGRLIRLLLYGLSGPVTVKGVEYNGLMPSHLHLSDEQVADVLTFIRSNFGNDADSIRAEDVERVRQATGRRAPWRAEELEAATGIPQ